MAPTQTIDMVVAPDPTQDEQPFPFLERMGFKQAFTPFDSFNSLRHYKKPRPPSAPKHRDGSWGSVDSNTSGSTAHSNASDPLSLSAKKYPVSPMLVPSAMVSRSLAPAEQNSQASQLTSFISRMKYLTDEGDGHDIVPSVFSVGGSLADQRNMIKAQASKVRNQFELKYRSLEFVSQMDTLLEAAPSGRDPISYNPLQTIRDRSVRPHGEKAHGRSFIWQIPVSEQVQDMRWRYQCAKLKAQKLKRRQKKASCGTDSSSLPASALPQTGAGAAKNGHAESVHENLHDQEHSDPQQPAISDHYGAPTSGAPKFNNPFSDAGAKAGRQLSASEGPTLSLPESSGGELIERLRSSHGTSLDRGSEHTSSSDASKSASMFYDIHEVDPLSSGSQPTASLPIPNPRRQFCRNSASFSSSSKNRMRNGGSLSSQQGSDGNTPASVGDDDLLKPLSKVSTNNSQTFSINSVKSSGSGTQDIFGFDTASSSSVSLNVDAGPNPTQINTPTPKPPVVTLTSDSGEQKVIESLKRTPRGGNLGNMKTPSPQKGQDIAQKSANALGADIPYDPSANICIFGSIRPGHADVRKAPWERAAHNAEEQLEFNILLFKHALKREDLGELRSRVLRSYVYQDACNTVSVSLKDKCVPQFLNYLSGVEHTVVSQQQILDADIASSLDALRVTTDRMVSEVNTTLNKQVREISSRMEKVTAKSCGLCTNASYTFLEYVVLSLMWVIWCVVKLWRFVSSGFNVLRGGCSMLIIA